MSTDISNSDDTIDSREVIERIDELESDLQDAYNTLYELAWGSWNAWLNNGGDWLNEEPPKPPTLEDWLDEVRADPEHGAYTDAEELGELKALADEAEGYGDWRHGETLIRESYFEACARELAGVIGATNRNAAWPHNCIDWERASRELMMDYTEVDFAGVAYLIRS